MTCIAEVLDTRKLHGETQMKEVNFWLRTYALLSITICISSARGILGYEIGHHDFMETAGIVGEERIADRVIRFDGDLDRIDLGLGARQHEQTELPPVSAIRVNRIPIYFKRSEIDAFLRAEKRKDYIVVELDKRLKARDGLSNRLETIRDFLSSIGYNRILVLGDTASGVDVLLDTEASRNPKPGS
jgi:hypothetical protein